MLRKPNRPSLRPSINEPPMKRPNIEHRVPNADDQMQVDGGIMQVDRGNQSPTPHVSPVFIITSSQPNINFLMHNFADISQALSKHDLPFELKEDGPFSGTLTHVDSVKSIDYQVSIESSCIRMIPMNYNHDNVDHHKEMYITMNMVDVGCKSLKQLYGFEINPTRLAPKSKSVSALCNSYSIS